MHAIIIVILCISQQPTHILYNTINIGVLGACDGIESKSVVAVNFMEKLHQYSNNNNNDGNNMQSLQPSDDR